MKTKLLKFLKKVVEFGKVTWKKLKALPVNWIYVLLSFGLLVSIIWNVVNFSQLKRMQRELFGERRYGLASDSARTAEELARHIDTLTVHSRPANAMVIQNRFDIEGESENNRVVTLSLNGELLQALLVKDSKFSFRNVEAKPGDNTFVVRSISEDGSGVVLEEINVNYAMPIPSALAKDFSRGSMEEKKIALTFDGDYEDNITTEILDILKQENVRCTIFVTGRYIRRYGDIVKRMGEDHHVIGNHTWTHPHLTSFEKNRRHDTLPGISEQLLQQELLKTAELYYQVTGKRMAPYWRAPYGEHNATIRSWAAGVGFRQIGWTLGKSWDDGMDTLDWVADTSASYYHSADEIAEKVLHFGEGKNTGANGAVILMHLGSQRNGDYPHLKLPQIIQEMKRRGYTFVTVPEML
ncbi:MAG: polysaccharide deacetylase family protein [Candidatus Zhuqueibacterota bacterium]